MDARPPNVPPLPGVPPPLPSRPSVKSILAGEHLEEGKGGMSEKQVADLLSPLSGLSGGALLLTMKAGEALGGRLNFKSARTLEHRFAAGYVPVVRAMALALGSLKNELAAAFDTPAGAVLEARMGTDFFSLGGSMVFELHEISPVEVGLRAQSEIRGQLFDWGKGLRALRQVVEKTEQYLRMLAPPPPGT